jgi:hypothetical protein
MNERIKLLAEQAGVSIDGMGYGEGNIEELIKLIVRECAKVADETQFKVVNYPVSIAIEKHFGVDNETN